MNEQNQSPAFDTGNRQLIEQLQKSTPQKFTIFDDERQPDFEFKPLSNRNIRAVMLIPCNSSYSVDEERIHYANLGEIAPDELTGDGAGIFRFKDIYNSQSTYYAALAEAMFAGFPKMVELNDDGEAVIRDDAKQLSENLLRDKVSDAFTFFLAKFGEIPYTQAALLNNLATNLSQNDLGQTVLKAMMQNGSKGNAPVGDEKLPDDSENGSS